jgi:predicted Zn-dependent protease
MSDTDDLEKDAQGKIVTRPVMGFSTAPIADMAIFLKVRYAETPEQLKTEGKSIQFAMTPDQALELASMMVTQARRIMDMVPDSPAN